MSSIFETVTFLVIIIMKNNCFLLLGTPTVSVSLPSGGNSDSSGEASNSPNEIVKTSPVIEPGSASKSSSHDSPLLERRNSSGELLYRAVSLKPELSL